MIIKFDGKHKSLKSFESDVLKDFSVITGKNGSGKSQLVEVLSSKLTGRRMPGFKLDIIPEIRNIQIEGLENLNVGSKNNNSWAKLVSNQIKLYDSFKESGKKLVDVLIKSNTWINQLSDETINDIIDPAIISHKEFRTLVHQTGVELKIREFGNDRTTFQSKLNYLKNRWPSDNYYKMALLVHYVSHYQNKDLPNLTESDFYNTPIPGHLIGNTNLFTSQIEDIFYNYAKTRDQNRLLFNAKVAEGEKNSSISDIEFVKKHSPPWVIINSILAKHNMDFHFKGLDKNEFSRDVDFKFGLIKTSTNVGIPSHDLSSGEKVIIGLIIKLFVSSHYNKYLEFPEMIVLDEPDAHLHPEMSKLLIEVLNETFVQKIGIKVIMTTHSPSTAALCPEDSLYQIENEPITILKQVEKVDALNLLTRNLPTLSIDYKNHKQVFVESPTDVIYFQTIFNKLNEDKDYPFRLYFISNSMGKGNCDQVIKIVKDIRTSGNQTSFGIIDWDEKNSSKGFVKVHGEGKRYSIENFLYDPIYLSILLMNLEAHNVYNDIGLDETINQYSIGQEDNEYLQKISDWYFGKYYEIHNISEADKTELVEIEYLNNRKIKVPIWYLNIKGHDFEKRIKTVFPAINGKYTSEGSLQKAITLIIGKCYPFIPKESEFVINQIIENN